MRVDVDGGGLCWFGFEGEVGVRGLFLFRGVGDVYR